MPSEPAETEPAEIEPTEFPPAEFAPADAARHVLAPGPRDDKYSRGVLGVQTGSDRYPGAAVLGVEAALRTGVGMVRYVGDERPTSLVLQRRPEVVPGGGRVQGWLLGSGQDAAARDDATAARLGAALADGVPVVLDSGALDLVGGATGPVVVTPHAGEFARMTGRSRDAIEADPVRAARAAADELGVVVLLKGSTTIAAAPGRRAVAVHAPTSWLATAGSGDALAGVLGALVATHHAHLADDGELLAPLAATAATIHGLAAARASAGGPVTVLDVCESIPHIVRVLLADAARQRT